MSKAIPLRRSRSGARSVAVQPSRRWSERLTAGVRAVLAPPRQVWLASLGGTALVVRAAQAAWSRAVAEGAAIETWLLRSPGAPPETE